MVDMDNLTVGQRYRIMYLPIGARISRVIVAAYMGKDYHGHHEFSLRPLAGTTVILRSQLRDIEPTTDDVHLARRVT